MADLVPPPYAHVDLFPLGEDKTPYRKLGSEGVSVEKIGDREVLSVSREAIRRLEAGGALPVDLAIARTELAAIRFDRGDKAEARTFLAQALPTLRDALLPQETSRAAAEALAKQLDLR